MENSILNENSPAFLHVVSERDHAERMDRLFEQAVGGEDVSRREENVKHFSLGHNRYQAVMYPEPVHYRDNGTGEWVDIDNTLEEVTNETGRSVLRNRANRIRIEFPCTMDGGSMASFTDGMHTLAWRFERDTAPVSAKVRTGAQIRQAQMVEAAKKLPRYMGRTMESLEKTDLSAEIETHQQRRGVITALKAENIFENVLPGVSVRYSLTGDCLKEDIILADRYAIGNIAIRLPQDYSYEVDTRKALLVIDKENGEPLFTMDTPIVYDANGKETTADIILTDCGNYTRMEYVIDDGYLEEVCWPVIIDPVIHSYNTINNVQDTTIGRGYNYGRPNDAYVMVGKMNSTIDTVAMLKFIQLARLTAQDTVVSAILRMKVKSSADSKYIGAYEILKPWNVSSVTWPNFNPDSETSISKEAIDCVPGASSGWLSFDLTNLYRKWCTKTNGVSNNNGVAFRTPGNIAGANYSELYSANASSSGDRPVMYVNYVSHAGIEDWWEYEDMGVGRAGTVYTDLFNGNMILEHSDTVMTGNRNPVSVNHYYNSCLSDTNSFGCGFGWKTDAHQTITYVTNNNEKSYFVWTDGDGTRHYFEHTDADTSGFSSGMAYKDAEGMELELIYHQESTITQCYITITDREHNVMRFNVVKNYLAWLAWTKDACGNQTTYSYVSGHSIDGRLDKITDPVGRITQFGYNSDGLISSIAIPAAIEGENRYVFYTYDDTKRLTGIRYSELGGTEPHTTYSYDGTGNMLISARNYDGMQVDIEYEAASIYDASTVGGVTDQMRRVLSLETVATDENGVVTQRGSKQTFSYKTMCTEVTAVKNTDTDDGKKLYYQFNDAGNVTCVRDDLGFAVFTKFDSNIENRPSAESRLRKVVVNLLRRADFSSVWTGSGLATIDTATRCLNAPSVKLTGGSGEAYYRQDVELETGAEYTFSAYVKSTNISGGTGAFLRLTSENNTEAVLSETVIGSTEEAINNGLPTDGWERIWLSFKASAGGVYHADLVLDSLTGIAWMACPQIEMGPVPNSFNIVSNGDFRYTTVSGTQTLPLDWSKASNTLNTVSTGIIAGTVANGYPDALSGNFLAIEGIPSKDYVGFVQKYNMAGNAGDIFTLGGWANSKSVANNGKKYRFSLLLRLKKADGTWSGYTDYKFNPEWCGWQFACFAAVASCDYTQVELSVSYLWNCNVGQFSNIFLHREAFGESYAYNDDMDLIAVTNLVNQKSNTEYDSAKNVCRYTQPGRDSSVANNQHWAYYGNTEAEKKKHLPWRTRTPMHMMDYFYYDSYGNTTASSRVDYGAYANNSSMTVNTGEGSYPHIRTETSYTANGNFVSSVKDPSGNIMTQSVNLRDGCLISTTDPAGQTVEYNYDASKRMTKVKAIADGKTYENNYTYDDDRIKSIRHNNSGSPDDDVTYTFGYDDLGRETTVHVGNQLLSENIYCDDRGGLLERVDYGNGGKVCYIYDEFDRITSIRFDDDTSDRYNSVYGANGEVAEVTDLILGETKRTEYDLADRPCQSEIRDSYSGSLKYKTRLVYDKRNNLVQFAENVEGKRHKSTYSYDRDNRVISIDFDGTSDKVQYTYDALGRVSTKTVINSASILTTAYTYVLGGYGTNSTTPLIAKIEQNGEPIEYDYDNRGNIKSEKRNNLITTYDYDGMNQLIRVNDPRESATWVYNYNCGGNIISKVRYAYTTGELGNPVETISYVYNDSNWKDKLTAFDGRSIICDEVGNLLDDGVRRFTWAAGRQLRQIEMPMTAEETAACIEGVSGEARLVIDFNGSNVLIHDGDSVTATARFMNGAVDMTNDIPAAMFSWIRDSGNVDTDTAWNNLHTGMKHITIERADINESVKFNCTLQPFENFGSLSVDDRYMVCHTPREADENDVFTIVDGNIFVDTEKTENAYALDCQCLSAETILGCSVTASARAYSAWPDKAIEFKYNADGLRVQKKVTAGDIVITTDFILNGKTPVEMKQGNDRIHFFYDQQGNPVMILWNDKMYTYVRNLQGDIIAILDSNGIKVVEYNYDAWGRNTGINSTLKIAELNPFRYRGYIYDDATAYYYLESRYYDPQMARFIQADDIISNNCFSCYSYCDNSPIYCIDRTGELPQYTDVNIHLYNKEHWAIEIYGVLFHSTKKGYYIEPRNDSTSGAHILVTAHVPKKKAIKAIDKALSFSKNKVSRKYKQAKSLVKYFKKYFNIYVNPSKKAYKYNRWDFPCAAFVDKVYSSIGRSIKHVWGNPIATAKERKKSKSMYLVSSMFVSKYGYRKKRRYEKYY